MEAPTQADPFKQLLRVAENPKKLAKLSGRSHRPLAVKPAKPRDPLDPPSPMPHIEPIRRADFKTNVAAVRYLLSKHGPLWTAQLMQASGLSRAQVQSAVRDLREQGWVTTQSKLGLTLLCTLHTERQPVSAPQEWLPLNELQGIERIDPEDFPTNVKAILHLLDKYESLWGSQLAAATGLNSRQVNDAVTKAVRRGQVTSQRLHGRAALYTINRAYLGNVPRALKLLRSLGWTCTPPAEAEPAQP